MSEPAAEQGATRPAETVAGFIAAAALAVGVIAIYYEPVKLAVPALIVALIAVAIGGRFHRLASRRRRRDHHRLGARDDLRGHRGQAALVARHQGLCTALLEREAAMRDVDALNAGYAGQLLEQYLENPSSVPPEWRALFERGTATSPPPCRGSASCSSGRNGGNGHERPPDAPAAAPPRRTRRC